MAENKFIQKLKGKQSAKSLIEIEKAGSVASFGSMPIGSSDAQRVYADARDNAVVIANSAINWKVQNSSLVITDVTGDGQDYSGNVPVSGISDQQGNNLWLNAQYTVPADGMLFTANTKWVLKLCGDNLINSNGSTIDFTVVLKLGAANIITKTFTVAEQANFFNKELVIDFEETNSSAIKLSQGDTITLQLLSGTTTASARIYTGMTVLSCLQRKITGDLVDIKGSSVEDLEVDLANHIADKNNPHEVTKAQVGLGNCDNTSDLNKPISTATQTALNGKVNIDGSSIMTGPLKMRSGSMRGAIAPYWNGIGLFKLESNNNVTLLASMEDTYGFLPADTSTYNLGSSTYKWKDAYIARVITGVLNNGADINVPTTGGTLGLNDFSNITDSAKNIANWSSNVSNCITEIPQDIKLELNAGVLTLKAGSKVYKPNGSGVFDEVSIGSDKTFTYSYGADTWFVFITPGGAIDTRDASQIFSGTTEPAQSVNNFWYDTTNNLVKKYYDGAWHGGYSLPIAIITTDASQITSIDQIFNGFGYIGSTVFVLPGVKGLIPDGRNADGTLKNTTTNDFTTVKTVQVNTSTAKIAMYSGGGIGSQTKNFGLNEAENYNYDSGVLSNALEVARVIVDSNAKITALTTKTTFHAVDYNDTEYIANQAMPSDRYVDLTLGASGSTYIAPADGWVIIKLASTGGWTQLLNQSAGSLISATTLPAYAGMHLPVKKGDVFQVEHPGSADMFRFIYAQGAQ